MKKLLIFKNRGLFRRLPLIAFAVICVVCYSMNACKDDDRFDVNAGDNIPPGKPVITGVKSLYGGARFYYKAPKDEDVLSIDAEYTNEKGKTHHFTASYYADSLDIVGFGDTQGHIVKLYAVDRAGNHSEEIEYVVTPLEPVISLVSKSLKVKPGFSSFFVEWKNELLQTVHVHVSFKLPVSGTERNIVMVFSSNGVEERHFVNDLYLSPSEQVEVSIHIEDLYGNSTEALDFGRFSLLEDSKLPKELWRLPLANDSIAGVPMMYGDALEGRTRYVIDDIINIGDNLNFLHTNGIGRNGVQANGNVPWNLMIDLGDYYELSRIVTHQLHCSRAGYSPYARENYYKSGNVGIYSLWILNETTQRWDSVTTYQIPVPVGLTELEMARLGDAGDMAYFYPEEPQYTPPTRWIRYEALKAFDDNYSATNAQNLSEITLYGRKAAK
jgi:hypothetical protein